MFMEDEQGAAINATVTSRQALLDNNPHFIFLHKHTEPVLNYDMIYWATQTGRKRHLLSMFL